MAGVVTAEKRSGFYTRLESLPPMVGVQRFGANPLYAQPTTEGLQLGDGLITAKISPGVTSHNGTIIHRNTQLGLSIDTIFT